MIHEEKERGREREKVGVNSQCKTRDFLISPKKKCCYKKSFTCFTVPDSKFM
jgi:hypothetical protein